MGRQECGRRGEEVGAHRGLFLLYPKWEDPGWHKLSILLIPAFPDLERCLLAHGGTSINIG